MTALKVCLHVFVCVFEEFHQLLRLKGPYYEKHTFSVLEHVHLSIQGVYQATNSEIRQCVSFEPPITENKPIRVGSTFYVTRSLLELTLSPSKLGVSSHRLRSREVLPDGLVGEEGGVSSDSLSSNS